MDVGLTNQHCKMFWSMKLLQRPQNWLDII